MEKSYLLHAADVEGRTLDIRQIAPEDEDKARLTQIRKLRRDGTFNQLYGVYLYDLNRPPKRGPGLYLLDAHWTAP